MSLTDFLMTWKRRPDRVRKSIGVKQSSRVCNTAGKWKWTNTPAGVATHSLKKVKPFVNMPRMFPGVCLLLHNEQASSAQRKLPAVGRMLRDKATSACLPTTFRVENPFRILFASANEQMC